MRELYKTTNYEYGCYNRRALRPFNVYLHKAI